MRILENVTQLLAPRFFPLPALILITACASKAPVVGFKEDPILVSRTRTQQTTTKSAPSVPVGGSKCQISSDSAYGYSIDHPIQVGGDFLSGPTREQQYLGVLRGPRGEGLRFERLGASIAPDRTVIDVYEVTYKGQSSPVRLYLDEYHFETLKAPVGFTCASPIPLAKPRD